jgi:hypothetical protein
VIRARQRLAQTRRSEAFSAGLRQVAPASVTAAPVPSLQLAARAISSAPQEAWQAAPVEQA